MTTRIALKNSKKAYLAKRNFIITAITDKNHKHDFNVSEAFNMKDYHDLYYKLMFYYWLVCLKLLRKNPQIMLN